MKELDKNKVALITGIFISGFHVVWTVLIVAGLAQTLLDFVFWMHMLTTPYRVTGFSVTQALILIVVTFVVGYVGGWLFAWLWNKMHGK